MGDKVTRVKTEISEIQMAQAIIESWNELFENVPNKSQVSLILAQNALETGHRKSMWNNNVGNITTDGKGQFDYFDDITTDEQVKPGTWKKMNLKYRAYPTLKDGMLDYLRFLSKKGGRYSAAWTNIVNPDPIAFSKALKNSGYYTANEVPYTKTLNSLYNRFNKSKSYEQAKLKKEPIVTNNKIPNILDHYIQMVSAAENISIKKIYKNTLPNHNILIQIKANNYNTAIEFSRVLCTALDEDLLSTSYPHTDGNLVEIECNIAGPDEACFQAVQQMSEAVADVFKEATIKLGGLTVKTNCIMDEKSFFQPISYKTAENNYRKFILKFI